MINYFIDISIFLFAIYTAIYYSVIKPELYNDKEVKY